MQMNIWICGISIKDKRTSEESLQTTQPTSGGAVTVVANCCTNCAENLASPQWGSDLPFFSTSTMRKRWMADATPHQSGWY